MLDLCLSLLLYQALSHQLVLSSSYTSYSEQLQLLPSLILFVQLSSLWLRPQGTVSAPSLYRPSPSENLPDI